jgi:hypothetical protein
VQYLQPTTALSAGGLALMAYAGVKPYLLHYGAAAARTPKPQLAARWEALEAGLLARVYGVGCALVQLAWCGGTAAAWLAQRALLGRSFTTSAFSAAALWVLLLISELRVFGQVGEEGGRGWGGKGQAVMSGGLVLCAWPQPPVCVTPPTTAGPSLSGR